MAPMHRNTLFLIQSLILFLVPNSVWGQWVPTAGPSHDPITCLTSTGVSVFAGTSAGTIFSTTNGGDMWMREDSGLTCTYIFSISIQGTTLVAGTDSGVFVSTNGGSFWSKRSLGLSRWPVHAVVGNETRLIAATDSGVFISSDGAESWRASDSGLTFMRVLSLAVSNGTLIAGTAGGGFFVSNDDAAHWSSVEFTPGYVVVRKLFLSGDNVYAAVGYSPPYYAASYAGVSMSTDHGESWKWGYVYGSIEGGGMVVFDFAANGTNLFEAASWLSFMNPSRNGVFISSDSGKSWSPVIEGLQDSSAISLAVFDSHLFAGTLGAGVWKRPLAEMATDVTVGSSDLPGEFQLQQNYPNPFNPSTTIRFAVQSRSHVHLSVFNILGQKVAEVVDEEMNAGNFEKVWNATVASGLYFYRLEAVSVSDPGKRFVDVKKMILLK
jgi:photosystem II stability/assembly factor-like uncharacterized protein